jgi:hypothetical protein
MIVTVEANYIRLIYEAGENYYAGSAEYSDQHFRCLTYDTLAEFIVAIGKPTGSKLAEVIEAFKNFATREEFAAAGIAIPDNVVLGMPDDVEVYRAKKMKELSDWWDAIVGLEVAPGIVLPTREAAIGVMGVAAMIAMGNGVDLSVDDVNDKTVIIPKDDIQTTVATYFTLYNANRVKWDVLEREIMSARTVIELRNIKIH